MNDRMNFGRVAFGGDGMPTIYIYHENCPEIAQPFPLDLLPAPIEAPILPIKRIDSMDGYLKNYGAILGKKAIHALVPLHVPGRDPIPDFDGMLREPFPCQKHVIAATVKMLDKVGSGFIVGEMGTGKTLLGMLAIHYHAMRSRKQGGSGGKYRGLILCPDHLIGKWVREIEETIPAAIVTRFGPQGGEDDDAPAKGKRAKKGNPKPESNSRSTLRDAIALLGKSAGRRWEKPKGAEWFVLGRNQAKWLSDWSGMADIKPGFGAVRGRLCEIATGSLDWLSRNAVGEPVTTPVRRHCLSSKCVVVDSVAVVDEMGRGSYDKFGGNVMKNVLGRVHYCPSCGQIVRDKKGVPLSKENLQSNKKSTAKTCLGTYLQMLPAEADKKPHGLQRINIPDQLESISGRIGHEVNHAGYRWVVGACKSPLYNYTSRPYRWSPARVIQKKCKRMFKYLVIDEVHEQKSDESAQSMACSKLIGAVDHVLALTGTIIGGYANHIYPLLMRIAPKSLREEGFEWGKDMAFSEAYGRIDKIITTKEEDDGPAAIRGNTKSMRRAKSGSRNERKTVRPGIMPTMFGRHMIGSSMFITLDELADELPDLFEYVGGPIPIIGENASDDERDRHAKQADGWVEVACEMQEDQNDEYRRVMSILEFTNRELLRTGSMKLLGTYLWTGLDYPDRPFGWGHDPEYLKAVKLANSAAEAENSELSRTAKLDADGIRIRPAYQPIQMTHTIGFWDKPGNRDIDNFVGVVTPQDCPESTVYPKEQALLDICLKQQKDGRQTWVYVQMTGKRDVRGRLARILEANGLKVGILKSEDVEPIDREEWIAKNGCDYDVMISHPQLVSTGLDLFSKKPGGHNYSTLVFYETGYNLFTMRQAARRAWRIGQPLDCRVYYLYYKETMQHKAMTLMSKKMAAAQALEGEFSEEGLAAMAGEDNLQMALAKNLSERIDDSDMQRSWGKVKSGPKKMVKRPTTAVAEMTSHGAKPSPLDGLPIELQIVSESLIESQCKPIPAAAKAGFEELADKLRALNLVFDAMSTNEEFANHEHESSEEADDEEAGQTTLEFDEDFNEEYVPNDGDMVMTEEILAKMFANMLAHGLEVV